MNKNSIMSIFLIILIAIGGYFLYNEFFASEKTSSKCPYEKVDLKKISELDIKEIKNQLDEELGIDVKKDSVSFSYLDDTDYIYKMIFTSEAGNNFDIRIYKENGKWQTIVSAGDYGIVTSDKIEEINEACK